MNRLEELNQMKMEIETMPEEMQMPTLKARVKKRVWRHRALVAVRNVMITLVALMGGLTIGVNTSESFADSVKSIPVLNKLAAAVNFSGGYEDAVREEYVTKIGKVVKTKYGDVVLSYAMSDDSTLVMFFGGDWEKKHRDLMLSKLIDADTGKEIRWSGCTSALGEKEKSWKVLDPCWREYHKHVTAELELSKWDGKKGEHKVLETVSFTFTTDKKLKSKEFTVKKEFEANGFSYRIEKVTMYPLSTRVEVICLDDIGTDAEQTLGMKFSLVGKNESRSVIEHNGGTVLGETIEPGHYIYYLESGYYMMDSGEVTLCLDEIDQLPKEQKEVIYDSKKKTLTDGKGELKDIKVIKESKNRGGEKPFEDGTKGKWLTVEVPDGIIRNVFSYAKKPDGTLGDIEHWCGESDSHYESFPIAEDWRDEDGKICLIRNYPEYIIKTDIKIPLKK